MENKAELLKKIMEDEDFIRSTKYSNSLSKFVFKNSEGVDNATIAKLLMISEEEVEKLYQEAVEALREEMVDDED